MPRAALVRQENGLPRGPSLSKRRSKTNVQTSLAASIGTAERSTGETVGSMEVPTTATWARPCPIGCDSPTMESDFMRASMSIAILSRTGACGCHMPPSPSSTASSRPEHLSKSFLRGNSLSFRRETCQFLFASNFLESCLESQVNPEKTCVTVISAPRAAMCSA